MTDSDDVTRTARRERPFGLLASLSHYDIVLAVIPVAFLVSVLVGHLLPISTRTALLAAALIGSIAMADALFFNPPIRPDGE
ncbi:hypothetical protein [Halorientalis marina]|jgi:hypothetical protein|uniref:hypothetical protein n=1 Tax=Halorientalis marina TaxID=2931976 RepID=UPI001FF4AD72|nr:hypothetical protein [Halorientalis marina]